MTTRLAISGFGRIGRMVLRAFVESGRDDVEIVLINTPGPVETSAHLYEFDSVHGRVRDAISFGEGWMDVGTGRIAMTHERDPAAIPHGAHGVDVVLECSGRFNDRDASAAHLAGGAKRVLVSAPCKQADATIVYGVNHDEISADHLVISNASCTTNCLAPVAKVMSDSVGIEAGYMTTIHAYTGDQPTLDTSHKDLRRARAAAMSMIPTSTGAARSVGEVLPHLKGKLDGIALRVPTPDGSVVDLVADLKGTPGADEINQALKEAADGPMKGILGYCDDPMVSRDIIGDPHSSMVDTALTMTMGNQAKVISWYDNEWGYSCRVVDLAQKLLP